MKIRPVRAEFHADRRTWLSSRVPFRNFPNVLNTVNTAVFLLDFVAPCFDREGQEMDKTRQSYTTAFAKVASHFLQLRFTFYACSCYCRCACAWFVLVTQYCAGDKIEKNEMGWACGAYGWGEGVYRVLVGKPEGKRSVGRPRRRRVDNIRMYLQEVECGYMD